MNKVSLIGRLTKDIELRYTANTQKAMAKFTLAVNRLKREDGADFINCIAWGKTAEIMEKYVKKGHLIGITGRIHTGSYEKDGHKVYTTDVMVEGMEFLERREKESNPAPKPTPEPTPEPVEEEIPEGFEYLEDDIPF